MLQFHKILAIGAFCLLCFAVSISIGVVYQQFEGGVVLEPDGKREIIIGGPLPLDFLYGWTSYRGMQMAIDEINAAGGVNVGGKQMLFKIVPFNTRDLEGSMTTEEVLKNVEKFIIEQKPDFLIGGPARSEAGVAMLDLLRRHKIVHILTTGVLTPLYHKKIASDYDSYKYGFRITSHVGVMANDFLNVAKEIRREYGLNKVYMMLQKVEHAQMGGKMMEELFKEGGFEIVGEKSYATGATDYSIGLLEAAEKKAEILFLWMDMPESAILLKQWYASRIMALPMGFVCAAEQPHFGQITKGAGEYLIVNLANAGNAPGNVTDWTVRFVNAYIQRWAIEPEGYGASTGYMAPYILKDAIERAGTLQVDAVIGALEQTDLEGVYGRIRFDRQTHQIISATDPNEGAVSCVVQWQNNKRVQVYPPCAAQGKIRIPEWMKN